VICAHWKKDSLVTTHLLGLAAMSRRRRHAKPAMAYGARVFGLNHSSLSTALVVFLFLVSRCPPF